MTTSTLSEWGTAVGRRYRCTCTHAPLQSKGEKGRDGGCGSEECESQTSDFSCNWMAFICISSCMIQQHHFTTVRNITFILQMLIYDKQLIWETSYLRSIKDNVTFIFFCLQDCVCATASIHTNILLSPLGLQLDVSMCVWIGSLAICHKMIYMMG